MDGFTCLKFGCQGEQKHSKLPFTERTNILSHCLF